MQRGAPRGSLFLPLTVPHPYFPSFVRSFVLRTLTRFTSHEAIGRGVLPMDVPIDGSIERSTVLYVSSFFLFSLSLFLSFSASHHSRTLIFTPRFSPLRSSSFVPLSLPSRLHTEGQGERGRVHRDRHGPSPRRVYS